MLVAIALGIFSFYLYGYLQPHSRYNYRAVMFEALHEGWNARAQENVFADAGRGFTLTADEVDASGRHMKGVFIRRFAGGYDEIITSETEIGRASCRERVCQYVLISVVAVSLKKKKKKI